MNVEDSAIGTWSLLDIRYLSPYSACRLKIQPYNDTLGLGEVSKDFFDRRREPSYQSRNGNDLITLGQLRLLQQVNHFDAVLALQFVLTNLLEVGDRNNRVRGLARDVKPQFVKLTPLGFGGAALPC